MITKITGKPFLLFILFWILTSILYSYGYKNGFYEDFNAFLENYTKYDFLGYILSPKQSLYYGVNTFHYIFITLFGAHPLPWFLLFTALHALNGTLILRFFKSYFDLMQWKDATVPIFWGTLLFIASPIVAEVVIWKACSHYMTSVAMIFLILNWFISFLKSSKTKYVWLILITFFLSTFFLEYFYLTPVFIFITGASLFFAGSINKQSALSAAIKIFLPILLLFALYFIELRLLLNKSVARVGDNAMSVLSPSFIMDRLSKYTARIYFFDYFSPLPLRQKFYTLTATKISVIITGIIFLGITVTGIIRYRKLSSRWKIIFALFIFSYCSCVVILPMWFYDMFFFQGNRYYYLPCLFFYILLSAFLYGTLRKRIASILIIIYSLINITGTLCIARNVGISSKLSMKLMDNFKWKNADTVLLLNLPALYNGISTIQADSPSNFNLHLKLLRNDSVSGIIYDVSSHNMISQWDGAHVIVTDSTHIKIILNQYGTWFWYKGFGAYDYENELYKVEIKDNGFTYQLGFKHKPSDKVDILYQVGGKWKKVNMNNIGGEQW